MIPREKTTLTDGTLTLRPIEVQDAPALVAAVQESVADVMPWLSWCSPEYDLDAARAWLATLPGNWQAGIQYGFAITTTQEGSYLGCVGLNQVNPIHRLANLGYWVRTTAVGGGVATRAARLVAKFGFERLGLQRVEIVVAAGNQRCQGRFPAQPLDGAGYTS
jgi:ribosomal-protein-serine acetyltransferase